MSNIKLDDTLIKVIKFSGFTVTDIQSQNGKHCVTISRKNYATRKMWHETICFDGTTNGFVQAVNKLVDDFIPHDSASQWNYEDLCFLFDNLIEEFGNI